MTQAEPARVRPKEIRQPGLVRMDPVTYHADPVPVGSVSSTLLKVIFQQSPAHARHYLDHGRAPKDHYDLGSALHSLALGEGRELAVWDGATWHGTNAQAFKQAAYAADEIPVLAKDVPVIEGMVSAIRRHHLLGRMLEPGRFTAEQAAFWIDPETGLWCRAMWDAVPHYRNVLQIIDLKSTKDASPDAVSRAVLSYRYDMQAAHYTDGARVLRAQGLLDFEAVRFLLAFVEKEPPHVITVRPIGERTAAFADEHRREALHTYKRCVATGVWPGYDGRPLDAADVEDDDYDLDPIEVPYWALRNWENR